MCRFQDAIVFCTCVFCEKPHVVGCHHFGAEKKCDTCSRNCIFRKAVFTNDDIYQSFETKDLISSSICEACFEKRMTEVLKTESLAIPA